MINSELFKFIKASPTAFHAVENVAKELEKEGFTELFEGRQWSVQQGRGYFVRRNSSSLIAIRIPSKPFSGFMLMAAHSDSPSFKLKEDALRCDGSYSRLAVEKYGGMICSSWLDRPLSAAGRVLVRENGGLREKLVDLKKALFLIPNLAIHMDRNVNEGKAWNVNSDMLPLMGSGSGGDAWKKALSEAAGCAWEDIVSKELFLYALEEGIRWGVEDEYISSPRLDDLQCVFACMKGFLQAEEGENAQLLCVFDNEEVGSGTKQGADSDLLSATLERVSQALGMSTEQYRAAVANSFMVSADNAHAKHPNHPALADAAECPVMNGGVVIKYNANQKYTTDAVSAAFFSEICRLADVAVQRYSNRPDMAGGSTLGNISSAHLPLATVDVGLAQLAMHSAVETAGASDTEQLIRAAAAFYGSSYKNQGGYIAF